MRNKILIPVAFVAVLILTGCNAGTPTTTANTNTNSTTSTSNSDTNNTPTIANSCDLITADDVNSTMGLTVTAHETPLGSCNLINDAGVNILLQVEPIDLYNPAQYTGVTERTDIGEKAFVQTPVDGSSVSQAFKNGKTYIFSINSQTAYTTDQVAALMKVVVGRG